MAEAARNLKQMADGNMFHPMANRSMSRRNLEMSILDKHVLVPTKTDLGDVVERTDIQSSVGPFRFFPGYRVTYPYSIVRALGELYGEYNQAFISSVQANAEWDTDYRHCLVNRLPVNFAVQIDMVGLPDSFLQVASGIPQDVVKEVLRKRIFEIENSVAMYQLLERVFSGGQDSFFKTRFRATLNRLRKRFKKPIALLAVTRQKYDAMKALEFGKERDEPLSDAEVLDLSGFDKFLGPEEFRRHVTENRGECEYLVYARTSDPVAKLKNPEISVEHPLLSDPEMRRIIKANVLTFNIDDPQMNPARKINDTKEYQIRMGMAFPISTEADLFSLEFAGHLFSGRLYADFSSARRLSPDFTAFLDRQGIDPMDVDSGKVALRCKPKKCAYGCYGHVVGALNDGKFRSELRRNLRQREGGYVVQPEMVSPRITNLDGTEYVYIDRNFMSLTNGHPQFLGGFRSLMPVNTVETRKGRNHGNGSTVLAEIVA